jgi:hypothetical protein
MQDVSFQVDLASKVDRKSLNARAVSFKKNTWELMMSYSRKI